MPKVVAAFEFKIRLIELVQCHPWLHNKHHPDHKNKETKLMSWEEIGHELGTTGDSCRDQWKKLCNQYSSYKSRCGRDGGVPTWPLYHHMADMIGGEPELSVMKAPVNTETETAIQTESNASFYELSSVSKQLAAVIDLAHGVQANEHFGREVAATLSTMSPDRCAQAKSEIQRMLTE